LHGAVGLRFEPSERVVFRAAGGRFGFRSGKDAQLEKIAAVDLQRLRFKPPTMGRDGGE